MSFSAIFSFVRGLIELALKIPEWIAEYKKNQADKQIEETTEEVKKGVEEAKNAKTLDDKANAACKIEKALNPNSTCDK